MEKPKMHKEMCMTLTYKYKNIKSNWRKENNAMENYSNVKQPRWEAQYYYKQQKQLKDVKG